MRKLNKDIRNYTIIEVLMTLIMALAFCGAFALFMSGFYPVRVDGEVDILRRIIRYAMYGGLGLIFVAAAIEIDFADKKIKELREIRRRKMRGR